MKQSELEKVENNQRKMCDIKRDKIGMETSNWVEGDEQDMQDKLRLVYVDTVDNSEMVQVCYFSEKDPKDVWGDDWGDVPYEHNAGVPYEYNYYLIAVNVKAPSYGHINSPYSVKSINQGEVPWLKDEDGNGLYAGATVKEFIEFMKQAQYGLYF